MSLRVATAGRVGRGYIFVPYVLHYRINIALRFCDVVALCAGVYKARRENWRFWWTLTFTAIAAVAAIIAAVEGWPRTLT